MFQELLVSALCEGDLSALQKKEYFAASLRDSFDQLVMVLMKIEDEAVDCEADWRNIVGTKHIRTSHDIIEEAKQCYLVTTNNFSLHNEKVWGWCLRYVFKAFDDTFRCAVLLLQSQCKQFKSNNAQKEYIVIRTRDFVDAIDSIRFLLTPKAQNTGGSSCSIVILPTQLKLCFCSCLDSLFSLMEQAVLHLSQQEPLGMPLDIRFVESSSAIASWILSFHRSSVLEHEVNSWLREEQLCAEDNCRGDESVVKRLKKLILRIDTFMKKIYEFAAKKHSPGYFDVSQEFSPQGGCDSRRKLIEYIVCLSEPNGKVVDHIERRAVAWQEEFEAMQSDHSPTKRRRKRLTTKAAKRRKPSNNTVVSSWLQIDGADRDSYTDLDDFIVGE